MIDTVVAPRITGTDGNTETILENGESVYIYGIFIDPQSAVQTISFVDVNGNDILTIVTSQPIDVRTKFLAPNGFVIPDVGANTTIYVSHGTGGA